MYLKHRCLECQENKLLTVALLLSNIMITIQLNTIVKTMNIQTKNKIFITNKR